MTNLILIFNYDFDGSVFKIKQLLPTSNQLPVEGLKKWNSVNMFYLYKYLL